MVAFRKVFHDAFRSAGSIPEHNKLRTYERVLMYIVNQCLLVFKDSKNSCPEGKSEEYKRGWEDAQKHMHGVIFDKFTKDE